MLHSGEDINMATALQFSSLHRKGNISYKYNACIGTWIFLNEWTIICTVKQFELQIIECLYSFTFVKAEISTANLSALSTRLMIFADLSDLSLGALVWLCSAHHTTEILVGLLKWQMPLSVMLITHYLLSAGAQKPLLSPAKRQHIALKEAYFIQIWSKRNRIYISKTSYFNHSE